MKRTFSAFLLFTLTYSFSFSEEITPDSHALYMGPLFWNTAVWFPQKVAGVEFAQVTFDDWAEHLSNPWVWDNDEFSVNQVGHPYQGSLYFGSARGAGWEFTDSLSSVVLGSVTWEVFMENESSSRNDFIITTTGGAALGEMFFRLSESLIEDGRERTFPVLSNLGAWVLSPGGNLSRIIYGQDISPEKSPVSLTAGFHGGGLILLDGDEPYDDFTAAEGDITIDLVYGNSGKDSYRPYDLFFLRMATGGGSSFAASFFSEGLLWGTPLYRKNGREDLLGVFLHYDFIYNDIINLGANSLGVGWIQNGGDEIEGESPVGSIFLSFVALGSSECGELKLYDMIYGEPDKERRSYDLGFGGNLKVYREFRLGQSTTFWFRDNSYLFRIFEDGVPDGGSSGYVVKNLAEGGISRRINRNMSIQLSGSHWFSMTDYDELDDSSYSLCGIKLGVLYHMS